MLVAPPNVIKRRKRREQETRQNEELETLYNDFKDGEAEGKTVIIPDGIGKIKDTIYGNSKQESYNKLEITATEKTDNGVTLTNNGDGSVTLNGTATAKSGSLSLLANDKTFPIENLPNKFTFCVEDELPENVILGFAYADINGNWLQTAIALDKNNSIRNANTNSMPNNVFYIRIRFTINEGTVLNNVVVKPMLLEGTYTVETKPKFQQYGASPSVEYPQDVEVIDTVNRLLYPYADATTTKSGIAFIDNGNSSIKLDGTALGWIDYWFASNSKPLKLKKGIYTVKLKEKIPIGGIWFNIKHIEEDTYYAQLTTNSSNKKTFEVKEDSEFIVSLGIAQGTTFDNWTIYPMIYEGTDDKPCLPYGHIGLVQRGKNLAELYKTGGYFASGDGHFTVNNNFNSYIGVVKPYKTYFASNIHSNLCYFDENMNYITGLSFGNLFNTNNINNVKYVTFAVKATQNQVQIEEGDTASPYEPYYYNLTPIDLTGNKLAKVGNVKDLLNIDTKGSVKIKNKNIKRYVFTGDEAVYKNSNDTNNYLYYITNIISANPDDLSSISNYLKNGTVTNLNNNNLEGFCIANNSTAIYINIHSIQENNRPAEIKAFLKQKYDEGNPVYVDYVSATPETIPLPSISPIKQVEGITNTFELVTNLGTTMKVEYKVSNNSRLEALENEVNNLKALILEQKG